MAENEENELFESFMKEMENIRENWAQAHDDVENLEFRGTSLEEKIEVVLNGKFQPNSVSFEQAIRAGVGIKGLEKGVLDAIADAASKAEHYFKNQIEEAVKRMESTTEDGDSQDSTIERENPIKPRLSQAASTMTVQ